MINPADYTPLIRKTARRYYYIEDAEQEAWLCCCQAVNDFDESRNVKFSTFLMLRLRQHFLTLIRTKQKRQRANVAVKSEAILTEKLNCRIGNADQPREIDLATLPPRTREAARLMLEGKTLTQAARQMRITPQAVRNLLNRARKMMM
ncbi:MAG: sigma-70 family RNA polymerase sigma factor [Bacillota bacterium]